ncbi:MAG: type I-U CRISPR-associated protein Csb2 [Gammaproteobacteria bacterium]|nr:type I-U CRISPR-associated protein Csb2 [Gammaproteobacteria bacterium]
MTRSLLLSVRFHDGRYHGESDRGIGEWPPAPARLFQALVACAAVGEELSSTDMGAMKWLQKLEAPVIVAPAVRKIQSLSIFVPNNDLDKYGGDPRKISKLRVPKTIRPHVFDAQSPLLFVWKLDKGTVAEDRAQTICQIAERLYQLGRGVDMAWAWAEILNTDEVEIRLAHHGGVIYRPTKGVTGMALLCPAGGSLASLRNRYDANRERFTYVKQGRKLQQLFSQPPKPRFAKVMYDTPSQYFLYEMRAATLHEPFVTWPSTKTEKLVKWLRDKATERLKETLSGKIGQIERILIGRGATEADKTARLRVVPLPSIGHNHADQAIRRVLVEVPPNCPLRADDIAWAFSGIGYFDPTTGEILWNLVRSEEVEMLRHYGINNDGQDEFRTWRTITPAALPIRHPRRKSSESKRIASEEEASRAVMHALRHTGIKTPVEATRVQREPFGRNGAIAEEFAVPERFAKRFMRHVEISFTRAVRGPVIIGNGRYLGLGLMAPEKDVSRDVLLFRIISDNNIATADTEPMLRAVRRALMAVSKDDKRRVPRLFSGHEREGSPARSGGHEHVFLAAEDANKDGQIDRLIVAAPWACDRTTKGNRNDRASFNNVATMLTQVRAGKLGVLTFGPACCLTAGDPLAGPARVWQSHTPYCPTRHAGRRKEPNTAVIRDIIIECERRGLPKPEVELLQFNAGPNGGSLSARMRLHFAVAVKGPLMLGRNSHSGGGLFSAMNE